MEKNGFTSGYEPVKFFLCFEAIVRIMVFYLDFFVSFVLRHWWVLQALYTEHEPKEPRYNESSL